jgi:hypothetical protein
MDGNGIYVKLSTAYGKQDQNQGVREIACFSFGISRLGIRIRSAPPNISRGYGYEAVVRFLGVVSI